MLIGSYARRNRALRQMQVHVQCHLFFPIHFSMYAHKNITSKAVSNENSNDKKKHYYKIIITINARCVANRLCEIDAELDCCLAHRSGQYFLNQATSVLERWAFIRKRKKPNTTKKKKKQRTSLTFFCQMRNALLP